MRDEGTKETRRGFMVKSAFAVGAVSGGLFGASAQGQDIINCGKLYGPIVDYPWDVGVDCAARATLYLVMGRKVSSLIWRSLADTFEYMHDRVPAAGTTDGNKLVYAINHKGGTAYTLDNLKAALNGAKSYCTDQKSYAYHARNPLSVNLANALVTLETMIAAPLLHTDFAYIDTFLTYERERDIKWHGNAQPGTSHQGRCMEDLFQTAHTALRHVKHTDPQSATELRTWHDLRDSGLIWCSPRGRPWNKQYEANIVPNGRSCNSNGRCEDLGNKNDYCQEVDNTCNGMAT